MAMRALLPLVLLLGCGVDDPQGLDEPIRLVNGTFKDGALPGVAPADIPEGAEVEGPRVTAIEAAGGIGLPGQRGRFITGRTSPETYAIAVRLGDFGTGYWVRPVDAPDPANNGERLFALDLDVGTEAPPGLHPLRLVALDAEGRAGPQREVRICIGARIPDNLSACDPTIPPPALVATLTWDAPVDLDLVVLMPDGRRVSAERPRTAAPDATEPVGLIDQNGGAHCLDGGLQENLVFQELPSGGRLLVYAHLFDACDLPSVRFRASLHVRVSGGDGTWTQQEIFSRGGTLLADQTGEPGTYLFPIELP